MLITSLSEREIDFGLSDLMTFRITLSSINLCLMPGWKILRNVDDSPRKDDHLIVSHEKTSPLHPIKILPFAEIRLWLDFQLLLLTLSLN